eukprot:671644-Prymnesium_polylepis.2
MNHGITGMAALSLHRKFIGVEFGSHGFKLAKTRIEDYFKLSFDQQGDYDTDTALPDQEQDVQSKEQPNPKEQPSFPALFHCDECKNSIDGIRYKKSGDYDLCVTCFKALTSSVQSEFTQVSNRVYKRPRGNNKNIWFGTQVLAHGSLLAANQSRRQLRRQRNGNRYMK